MLNICVFSSYLYAQVEDSSIKFTDTSQQLLENARKEVLSDKNLSKRRIITKRISGQCDPNKNNLPPECKKENLIKNQKKNLISDNIAEISGKPVNSNNIIDNANLSRSTNEVGGLSTGGATLGITTLILVTGAAILTILSIGGYGDDDSNGVAGSGGSSSTAASAN